MYWKLCLPNDMVRKLTRMYDGTFSFSIIERYLCYGTFVSISMSKPEMIIFTRLYHVYMQTRLIYKLSISLSILDFNTIRLCVVR